MDWKLGLFLLQIISSIITITVFVIIKVNDLKHLNINVENIEKKLDKFFRKLGKMEKEQAVRKTICNERHPKK